LNAQPIPATAHQLSDTKGVVAICLIELYRQRGVDVPRVNAINVDALLAYCVV
jgi:hypothetical protein